MEEEKTLHQETNLNDLIKHICARPQMYAGYENFRMVAAFIQGFAYSSEFLSDELRDFQYWLALKFKLPRNVAWFNNLEKIYSTDEEVLTILPDLFDEFCKSDKDFFNDEFYWKNIIGRKK